MEISNFVFDGISLRDIGMIPGSINTDSQSMTPATLNFTVTTTPTSRTKRFVSSSYEDTISFEIGIVKNPCDSQDYKIDIELDRFIRRWLIREDGFKIMRFECEDYEDILVNCYLNVAPMYYNGTLIGYTITGSTDSPYVSIEDYVKEFSLPYKNTQNINIQAISDELGFLYPKIEITPATSGLLLFGFGNSNFKITDYFSEIESIIHMYDEITWIEYVVEIVFNYSEITVPGKVDRIISYSFSDYLPLSEINFTYDETTNMTTIFNRAYTWKGAVPDSEFVLSHTLIYSLSTESEKISGSAEIQAIGRQTYVLDCDKSIITGLTDPNDFNWIFPRMQQDWNHSDQTFFSNQACHVKITYTPRRKVIL